MKKLVVLVCVCMLMICGMALGVADEAVTTIPAAIVWFKPVLRQEPNLNSTVVESLEHGDKLEVEAFVENEEARQNGYMYAYTSSGNEGWILEESLCFWPETLRVSETGVKVYSSDSRKYSVTDGLPEGTELVLLEERDTWYVVSFRGASGFVSKLDNVYNVNDNSYYHYRVPTKSRYITETTWAYSYPDLRAAKVASYEAGERVRSYGALSDEEWIVIDAGGRYAYIPRECVK